jgi:hypothetical protein
MTGREKKRVAAIKAWALENYNKSYGASALFECYTDRELADEFRTRVPHREGGEGVRQADGRTLRRSPRILRGEANESLCLQDQGRGRRHPV